jgi:hypothetical protein
MNTIMHSHPGKQLCTIAARPIAAVAAILALAAGLAAQFDATPPSTPASLAAKAANPSGIAVTLTWRHAVDNESGVSGYRIYRDDVQIAETADTTFVDNTPLDLTSYSYQVSALNGYTVESALIQAVSITTPADHVAPRILAVSGFSTQTNGLAASTVLIYLSEPVNETNVYDTANYKIDNGVRLSNTIQSQNNGAAIVITTAAALSTGQHSLLCKNLSDLAHTPNAVPAANATAGFSIEPLRLWYDFNQASIANNPGTIPDMSPNRYNATIKGSNNQIIASKFGLAVGLSGNMSEIDVPANIVQSLAATTIAFWVRFDMPQASLLSGVRIFDFGNSGAGAMYLTPKGSTGKPVFAITTSGASGEQRITGSSAFPMNAWVHVAIALNGSTGILYINGVEAGRNTAMTLTPSSLGSTTKNYLGYSPSAANQFLIGSIDDFRIYARALSASEINANTGLGAVSVREVRAFPVRMYAAGVANMRAHLADDGFAFSLKKAVPEYAGRGIFDLLGKPAPAAIRLSIAPGLYIAKR